jgi:hypothetical protein
VNQRAALAEEFVAALEKAEFTQSQIADALGYTDERVRQIRIKLGLYRRRKFATVSAAMASLPRDLAERIRRFRALDFSE